MRSGLLKWGMAFLLLGSMIDGLFAEGNTVDRIVFDRFQMVEDERQEGLYSGLDVDLSGAIPYSEGPLPRSGELSSRMYSFIADFDLPASAAEERLSLYSGLSEYPFRIYLNGEEIFQKGRYEAAYNSSLRAVDSIFLSPALLKYGTTNRMVIEIYPREEIWGLDSFYIDETTIVAREVFLRNFVGINLIQGCFVMALVISLYFLILFFAQRKKVRKNLFFAVLSLAFCMAYYNVTTHFEANNEILLETLSKSGMVLLSTFVLLFDLEFSQIWNEKKPILLGILVLGLAPAAIVLFQTDKSGLLFYFGLAMNFLIVPEIILGFGIVLFALFFRKNKLMLPLLFAYLVVIGVSIHDVYYVNQVTIPYAWLTPYGFFAIVVAIFVVLAIEQTLLYHSAEQQRADLIVNQARIESLNKELTRQKNSFYRFVPNQFLELLGKRSAVEIELGDSSLRQLSVLFADIRQFTNISEKMAPDQNFQFLNSYLFRMEKAIQENNGFVDKYIGDAIMALFTSPEEDGIQGSAADAALAAALGMKAQLREFNDYLVAKNFPCLDIGVGINTGHVMLGTVGSRSRMDTTVIGDTVNISSRLENLSKFYRTRILLSEQTVEDLQNPDQFVHRRVDRVTLQGRQMVTSIYELLDPSDSSDRIKVDNSATLEKAIALYQARAFREALILFEKLKQHDPEDHLATIYIERCQILAENDPGKDWDGVYHSRKVLS